MKAAAITSTLLLALVMAIPASADTSLTMSSDQFDYIGQGQAWAYTDADGTFTARYDLTQHYLEIDVIGPSFSFWWYLEFAAADGQQLTTGTYTGCSRWPFQNAGEPGLSVSGMGRGCNQLCGSFTVHELSIGPGEQVNAMWITFTQYCECGTPGLYGDIRINSQTSPTEHATWGAVKELYRN